MSNVEQCRQCGKLFPFLARGVCGDCLEATEADFEVVRDYLREHDGAAIPQVAAETGVSERRIVNWMNEGRLERHGTARLSAEEAKTQDEARNRLLAGMSDAMAKDDAAADGQERAQGMMSRRRL